MIFGESAGGASVAMHLLMKKSWNYYTTATLESPGSCLPHFYVSCVFSRTRLGVSVWVMHVGNVYANRCVHVDPAMRRGVNGSVRERGGFFLGEGKRDIGRGSSLVIFLS